MTGMHEVGVKTLAALRERWPHLPLSARECDYGNGLLVTFEVDGKKYIVQTPEGSDYRHKPYLWWLHRFNTAIRQKVEGTS